MAYYCVLINSSEAWRDQLIACPIVIARCWAYALEFVPQTDSESLGAYQ